MFQCTFVPPKKEFVDFGRQGHKVSCSIYELHSFWLANLAVHLIMAQFDDPTTHLPVKQTQASQQKKHM